MSHVGDNVAIQPGRLASPTAALVPVLAPHHDGVGVHVEGQLDEPCFGARGTVIFRPGVVSLSLFMKAGESTRFTR